MRCDSLSVFVCGKSNLPKTYNKWIHTYNICCNRTPEKRTTSSYVLHRHRSIEMISTMCEFAIAFISEKVAGVNNLFETHLCSIHLVCLVTTLLPVSPAISPFCINRIHSIWDARCFFFLWFDVLLKWNLSLRFSIRCQLKIITCEKTIETEKSIELKRTTATGEWIAFLSVTAVVSLMMVVPETLSPMPILLWTIIENFKFKLICAQCIRQFIHWNRHRSLKRSSYCRLEIRKSMSFCVCVREKERKI